MKVRITEVGQPCRHCQTPVRKSCHAKPPTVKPGSYYYLWWLACPKCRALYMIDSAKVWFDGQPTFPIVKKTPREAPSMPYASQVFEETARMRDASILPWD